jgi:ankyrin repeat protein
MDIFDAIQRRNEEEVLSLLEADPTLLEVQNEDGDTPLIEALQCNGCKMVKLLLDKGANIHAPGEMGTALHYAADWGCEARAAFLLSQGADAYSTIGTGLCQTPLMLAARAGHVGVAKLLLRHTGKGALETRDEDGRTALHLAAIAEHIQMVAFLLSQGAQADSKDYHGATALMSAAEGAPLGVVKLLVRHMRRRALETGDRFGRKALHHAVRFACWEDEEERQAKRRCEHVVALLLSNKVRADSKNMWGRTPLMVAVRGGCLRLGVVKVLVDHTPRQGLEATDVKLMTALHHAACGGNEEAVTLLLSRKAQAHTKA